MPSPAAEASEELTRAVLAALSDLGVEGSTIRVLDHDVRAGEAATAGGPDDWPSICEQVGSADIVVVGTSWTDRPGTQWWTVLDLLDAAPAAVGPGRGAPAEKVGLGVVVGRGERARQVADVLTRRIAQAGFTTPEGGVRCWDEHELGRSGRPRDAATDVETRDVAAAAARLAAQLKGASRSLV